MIFLHFCSMFFGTVPNRSNLPSDAQLRTQMKWEKAGPGLSLETSEAFALKLGHVFWRFFFLYRRAVIGVAISRVYFSPNFPVYIFSANL